MNGGFDGRWLENHLKMTFKCHVWLSEGISVNYNCKSGRRCHLDQLARIDSAAWADDRWGCSSGISAVFWGRYWNMMNMTSSDFLCLEVVWFYPQGVSTILLTACYSYPWTQRQTCNDLRPADFSMMEKDLNETQIICYGKSPRSPNG